MATATVRQEAAGPTDRRDELVKLYVWEIPVRLSHWMMVCAIFSLCLTGYYMHNPFVAVHSSRAYLMGTTRFIHVFSGWVLISGFLLRLYWFFMGNIWARWQAFVPHTARQWMSLRDMVTYYALVKKEPYRQVGHNTLASVTYLLIYAMIGVECLTGLALFSEVRSSHALSLLIGWLPMLISIQYLRMVHYLILFVLLAFMVQHIYSAILVGHEERNGTIESIFTGYKFASRKLAEEEIVAAADQKGTSKLPKSRLSGNRGK